MFLHGRGLIHNALVLNDAVVRVSLQFRLFVLIYLQIRF